MSSIGARLTIWYVLMITATVATVLIGGGILLHLELIRSIDLLNAAQFQEIENRVEQDQLLRPEGDFLQQISEHSKVDAPLYYFQVNDAHGIVLFRSANMGRDVFPLPSSAETRWTHDFDDLGQVRIGTFSAGEWQVQIATSLATTRQLFHDYYQVSALVLVVVTSLSFFIGHWMSRLALDPIRSIQKTASRISAENLKERIPVSGVKDEISDLAALLNQTFDRLEKAFGRLSRFAGEASHELKTPLSIIRLQSEKLLMQGTLPAMQQEALQQQLRSIQGLNLVIEKLLFLARAESGAIQAQQKPQNTAAFISSFAEDALVLCEDRGVRFEIGRNEDALVSFDASLMRQVLLNLLSNSLKVTLLEGKITLDSRLGDSAWNVTVEDTGPGIVEAPLGENAPVADGGFTKGAGLGLAICRGILELHHGRMQVENRKPERGLRVILEIPRGAIPHSGA